MGCALCRRRQQDPTRGPSDWWRGVVLADGESRQVLVCPDCRRVDGWSDVLARCAACGSTTVVVRLGEVTCRDCGGGSVVPGPAVASPAGDQTRSDLGRDVAAAIDRVLGRG